MDVSAEIGVVNRTGELGKFSKHVPSPYYVASDQKLQIQSNLERESCLMKKRENQRTFANFVKTFPQSSADALVPCRRQHCSLCAEVHLTLLASSFIVLESQGSMGKSGRHRGFL